MEVKSVTANLEKNSKNPASALARSFLSNKRLARGLPRSPSLIGSAMQKRKHFCAALASLLVFHAADREPVVLVEAILTHPFAVVVHGLSIRIVVVVAIRSPKGCAVALTHVPFNCTPDANRQYGKGIDIGAIAVIGPTTCRFEPLRRRRCIPV